MVNDHKGLKRNTQLYAEVVFAKDNDTVVHIPKFHNPFFLSFLVVPAVCAVRDVAAPCCS